MFMERAPYVLKASLPIDELRRVQAETTEFERAKFILTS